MSNNKVTFGVTSKGKSSVIHKQYEFVRHRQYANGNIQWRCKCYQSSKCQARLTTRNDEIVSDSDPEHNHGGNKESIVAHQAVAEMKDKRSEVSSTTTTAVGSVSTQFQPDVFTALPKKMSLNRTLHRKRQKLQFDSSSVSYHPPPSYTTLNISDGFVIN